MEFALTSDERELVLEILEERHRELLREISRANHHQFKIALRRNEKLLESVTAKLRALQMSEKAVISL
ncbi:MAG TPA: hypothetical protein VFI95_24900 [Terriglobales bacterium]|nr:hypothetical protein [Terriglobales bacterium]